MAVRQAECSCGQLQVACDGEPTKVSVCHCDACKRRTSSAFGIAAFFARPRVTVMGGSTAFRRVADSGFGVTFHFCPVCGSTVWWEPERLPDLVAVGAGSFADQDFPAPSQSVDDGKRFGWVTLPDHFAKRAPG